MARTEITFTTQEDLWPLVDEWAISEGCQLLEKSENRRLYRKGVGAMVAASRILIEKNGPQVKVSVWVKPDIFTRICSLFILGAEIPVDSALKKVPGATRPARLTINRLLMALEAPLIV